jgi:hypothetical protein
MDLHIDNPDWYDRYAPGAQVCPRCRKAETEGHCDGWVSFCECDCTS